LINEPALDKLQSLRDRLGKPLIVRSAYRSPEHNRAVGGATRSKHMNGAAALRRAGEDGTALRRTVQDNANNFARSLRPVIEGLLAEGVTSLRGGRGGAQRPGDDDQAGRPVARVERSESPHTH